MPFLQGLPEVISRFILYSAELFLFAGLLAVTGERKPCSEGCFLLLWLVHLAVPRYDLCRIVKYLEDRVDTWSKMIVLYMGFIIVTIIMDIMCSMEEDVNVVNVFSYKIIF